jgi:hypothetical protein
MGAFDGEGYLPYSSQEAEWEEDDPITSQKPHL